MSTIPKRDERGLHASRRMVDPLDPLEARPGTAEAILERKRLEGPGAYLWVDTSGDAIVWPAEANSINDDGTDAVWPWQVDAATIAALIASGECDEVVHPRGP